MKRTITIVAILAALISLPAMAQNPNTTLTLTKLYDMYEGLSTKINKLTHVATRNNGRVQALEKKVAELEQKLYQEHLRVSELSK